MTRAKPRPGSLPLTRDDTAPPAERVESWWSVARRNGYTLSEAELQPFKDAFTADRARREAEANFTGLQKARAKAEELAGAVRDAAFDDWIRRCVVDAERPDEWTQARVLYESYLAHGQRFGRTRSQKAMSVLELATETQWGRMMATLFPKKRRTAGWYYPLRVKRGA